MNKVAHLHFHSEYSLQDSLIKIDDLEGLMEGAKAIALTDHGNVDGAIKFYTKLEELNKDRKEKTIPLVGCEFYVVDDMKDKSTIIRYHLVAIAKTRKGFSSIMKALTVANLQGFYYRPRISWDYLLENLEDVIIFTGCSQGLFSYLLGGEDRRNEERFYELAVRFQDKFGPDLYFEQLLLTDFVEQNRYAACIDQACFDFGIKPVFTNDVHYIKKEDWLSREIHVAVKYNWKVDLAEKKASLHKPGGSINSLYFKNYDEMMADVAHYYEKGFLGAYREKSLEAYEKEMSEVWDEIIEKCSAFELKPMKVAVPVAYEDAKDNPGEYMCKLCREKFEEIAWPDEDRRERAKKRMEHELEQICELKFSEYFLLVRDMVLNAKERGCMVGVGRGSVGGSLVAYLLGITGIDPLDWDLVFERFISPGRHDLPDIDLDFEDVKRDIVINYLREKYEKKEGECQVALVSTFAKMKGRGAIRDVGRVLNIPLPDIDMVAKQILVRSGGDARSDFSIEDTVSLFEKAKVFKDKYPQVIEHAGSLEGLLKNKGIHAAGVVVDVEDLYAGNKCVLVSAKTGDIAVNWDKKDLEYMGLMKIDALGLKTLNILQMINDLLIERGKEPIDYESIDVDAEPEWGKNKEPLNKAAQVMRAFQEGECIGAFQFGTAGMIQYIRDFVPEKFYELYQVTSLYRPGTLRSGLANKFIRIKNNDPTLDKEEELNPKLAEILSETYGIVLFQEQIMYILNQLGDIPWRTADMVRKVVSKSEGQDKFETFRQQFLEGCKRLNSLTEKEANAVFTKMKFFGSYGFNKSHACEYTILSYWTMWAKVFYPAEFYCACLCRTQDKDEISELLSDAHRRCLIKAVSPNINFSKDNWYIKDDNTLIAGFDALKGISARLALALVEAREKAGGKFTSYEQFVGSIEKRLCNRAKVKTLVLAGAFQGLMSEDQALCVAAYIDKEGKVPATLEDAKSAQEEAEVYEVNLSDIFNYELPEDFVKANKRLLEEVVKAKYKVDKLEIVKDEGRARQRMDDHWYIGKFDEIKYGYRTAVTSRKDFDSRAEVDSKGFASDLGGCYGIFRDDSYLYYATFGSDIYNPDSPYKGDIEDLAGKYILMRANKPLATTNIFVREFHILDRMKNGVFDNDLDLRGLVVPVDAGDFYSAYADVIRGCDLCDERKSCKQPVPFTKGYSNVMVIGEAPGYEEDNLNQPFVGRAGRFLWDLEVNGQKFDVVRPFCFVTNVQKCRPLDNKYTYQVAVACAKRILEEEIAFVKPKLILSLGSLAGRYLTGNKNFKITEANGKAVWSDKYGAWIMYSYHPSFVMRDPIPEKEALICSALEKFLEMFARLT